MFAYSKSNGEIIIPIPIIIPGHGVIPCIEPTDGMLINESTVFCGDAYSIPAGIIINADNIFLDCNGSTLIGDRTSNGIELNYKDGVNIEDCNIENYYYGVTLSYSHKNNLVNNNIYDGTSGIILVFSDNNVLRHNVISNGDSDHANLYILSSDDNFVADNEFLPPNWGVSLGAETEHEDFRSVDNKIFNNTIHGYGIVGGEDFSLHNIFCVNGLGNNYIEGATGPTCGELPIYARLSIVEALMSLIQTSLFEMNVTVTNILSTISEFESRISELEAGTGTTGSTTTTTIPSSNTTTIPSTTTTIPVTTTTTTTSTTTTIPVISSIAFLCNSNECNDGIEGGLIPWLEGKGFSVTGKKYNEWTESELDNYDLIVCSDESAACKVLSSHPAYNSHLNNGKPFVEIADQKYDQAAYRFGYSGVSYTDRTSSTTNRIYITESDPITSGYTRNVKILDKTEYMSILKDYRLESMVIDLADAGGDNSRSTFFKVDASGNHGRYAYVGFLYDTSQSNLNSDGETILLRTINWTMCGNAEGC